MIRVVFLQEASTRTGAGLALWWSRTSGPAGPLTGVREGARGERVLLWSPSRMKEPFQNHRVRAGVHVSYIFRCLDFLHMDVLLIAMTICTTELPWDFIINDSRAHSIDLASLMKSRLWHVWVIFRAGKGTAGATLHFSPRQQNNKQT